MATERWVGIGTLVGAVSVGLALLVFRRPFLRASTSLEAGERTWRVFVAIAVFAGLVGIYLVATGDDQVPF